MNDLSNKYGSMELEEVKFVLDEYIRNNDGPHFVNVPMWSQVLETTKDKSPKRQTNQIDQYELYKKRVESFNKVIDKREVKKIGNGNHNK